MTHPCSLRGRTVALIAFCLLAGLVGCGSKTDVISSADAATTPVANRASGGDSAGLPTDENLLQQIAYFTGGAYVRSSGADFGLDYLYERQLAKLEKHDVEKKMEKKYQDRYQWFLIAALAVLVGETFVVAWQ